MNKFDEMIKIANIHADRINMAYAELKLIFPLKKDKVLNFSNNEILLIELLINRFAKLQDYLGNVMIDNFLQSTEDYTDSLTMIDKINKLERLEIIEDAELWKDMRRARNHIAHEYPDQPELTAKYLNQIFDLTPKLLGILNNLKSKMKSK